MNVALWIIAGLLAAVFATAGALKLTLPKEKLAGAGLAWVDDFTQAQVRLIGLVELLAAAGLVLPAALDVVPVLVPVAAIGLAALMAGAALTHARRGETALIAVNVVLIALAVLVAVERFGPESFPA